jgi:hypothetical protein
MMNATSFKGAVMAGMWQRGSQCHHYGIAAMRLSTGRNLVIRTRTGRLIGTGFSP